MICLNCGRPNPSGTSLCDRCRERRPGLDRARGGVIYQRTRETARVTRRGPGILAVGVVLLAGLIFAGGMLAVFFAPRDPGATNPAVAPGSTPTRLPIFEQETPTPAPTPTATPWFPSFTPSFDLLSPSLSFGVTFPPPTIPGGETPQPTRTPTPATPTPVPGPQAKFSCTQVDNSTVVQCVDNSTGNPTSWHWEFEGGGSSDEQSPAHDFVNYGTFSVTLTVTNDNGSTFRTKPIKVQAPPCNEGGGPPGCIPTPSPSPTAPPTAPPTEPPPTAAPPIVP